MTDKGMTQFMKNNMGVLKQIRLALQAGTPQKPKTGKQSIIPDGGNDLSNI